MTEIEAVRARHSVRNYKEQRIEEEMAAKIREKIEELNRESGLHLQYIEDAQKTYNKLMNRVMGLDSAPSVIACVGREDIRDLDEKVGYYGEKLVLFAQDLGLNTCWAGTFNKKKLTADVDPGEKIVMPVILKRERDENRSPSGF